MYPFVVKINGYNDEYKQYNTNALVYASTYTEAMEKVENYFGNELYSCNIICVNDEGGIFEVTDEVADALIKNDGTMFSETISEIGTNIPCLEKAVYNATKTLQDFVNGLKGNEA